MSISRTSRCNSSGSLAMFTCDPPRLRFDSNQSSDWPIVFETIRVQRVEASRRTAMRLSLFTLGVFAAVVCFEKPAAAQAYPWCAYYDFGGGMGGGGAENCGWATIEQCMATVSGIGGSCGPNPMYQRSPGLYLSTKPPRRHSH